MRILMSGASGFLGAEAARQLTAAGHPVSRLTRSEPVDASEVLWTPESGVANPAALEGFDAVIHLAGESIADGRWSAEKKARIERSRVNGTRHLAEALAGLERKPAVFICASAIGFYGDRGDELLTEQSEPGDGFLADVCRGWEKATDVAGDAGIRVVNLRFGVILDPAGGALRKMLTPFKLCLGGRIGDGSQFMSWITRADAVRVIEHALSKDTLGGPVNTVAPQPVRNSEFTQTLGRVLGRWTPFPMPAFAARLAFGEVADHLLLGSARVTPRALIESGFEFEHADLESALRQLLGRAKAAA